ncbi:MAG: hypothetical protein JOY65_13440 [Acetobacteraceae bacterium]|nr:hypothetical protein [Acetobacteraceae bacterium]
MTDRQREVATSDDLLAAADDPDVRRIVVAADLADVPSFRLSPGQALVGSGQVVRFAMDQDGLRLTADNEVSNLHLAAAPDRRALFNDTAVERLGRMLLTDLRVSGVVRLLARDRVRSGHVEAHGIDIIAADARGFEERPTGFGVEVVAGVFTLWNQQADAGVTITADLTGLRAGRAGAPVRGSGIFVSGAGGAGGRLIAGRLETGPVFSDGGIAPGTPDRISGGVFVVHGAFVDRVCNRGQVTTYGANDMVLDNWGTVDHWTAEDKITSHGPSGIGFVNFGAVNRLAVKAAIETFGQGARGFNVYTGTVHHAEFERVLTHGDGAVGIQISQPVGQIKVRRGIETYGGTGDSLVKGVVLRLPATALSIKPGGVARRVEVAGGLVTHGADIEPLEVRGRIEALLVEGGFATAGEGLGTI